MDGLPVFNSAILVFILGYIIYTERKVTGMAILISFLPCQKNNKRRRSKCYKNSSTAKRSTAHS